MLIAQQIVYIAMQQCTTDTHIHQTFRLHACGSIYSILHSCHMQRFVNIIHTTIFVYIGCTQFIFAWLTDSLIHQRATVGGVPHPHSPTACHLMQSTTCFLLALIYVCCKFISCCCLYFACKYIIFFALSRHSFAMSHAFILFNFLPVVYTPPAKRLLQFKNVKWLFRRTPAPVMPR